MASLRGLLRRVHQNTTLFSKVLVANAIILVVGAVAGTWLTLQLATKPHYSFAVHVLFVAIGIYVSIGVNYLVLRVAFGPLFELHRTMERVQAGDLEARAPELRGDPDIAALARTFNLTLDRLAAHRRSVSRQILQALENERKRISRELHDESGQSLTTLIILLERLGAELEDDREACDRLQQIHDLALNTLDELRRLMYDLRPSILDDLGLIPAIRSYVNEKLRPLGVDVDLRLPTRTERLSDQIETALFRIIQESLTNILRHSEATRVGLTMAIDPANIRVEIVDNGQGFNVENVLDEDLQSRGLGLFGMRERADLVGGRVDITSAPGAGTRVVASIPRRRRRDS